MGGPRARRSRSHRPVSRRSDGRIGATAGSSTVWFQETVGIEIAELELPHGSWAATRYARGRAIPREPPSHVGSRPGVEPDGPVVRRGGAIDKALLL